MATLHALPSARSDLRFLFFTNECVGLGHLRRTLALARAVGERSPRANSLIVTGSTEASSYVLPPRVDTVKLPVLWKHSDGSYRSRQLAIESEELQSLRSQLTLAAAEMFDPVVAVVDKTPLGVRRELLPTLEALRATGRARLVLGLRDVEDDPLAVRRHWRQEGMVDAIRRLYDAVLVYGPDSTPDALDCLGLPDLGMPVHHCGYVGSPLPSRGPQDLPADYLLATAGGGVDGFELLDAAIGAVEERPLPCPLVAVTGPLMPAGDVASLLARSEGLDVHLVTFRPDMEAVIAGARAVIAMAGYNTVAELVRAGKPSLLVPRVRPSEEQLVRASALARAGSVTMLHPAELTATRLRSMLDALLDPVIDRRPLVAEEHDGARKAAELLVELATCQHTPLRSPARGRSTPAARTDRPAESV